MKLEHVKSILTLAAILTTILVTLPVPVSGQSVSTTPTIPTNPCATITDNREVIYKDRTDGKWKRILCNGIVFNDPIMDLREKVKNLFDDSIAACAQHNAGNVRCVIDHFRDNYRYRIVRDMDMIVGPPGTPGAGYSDAEPRPCQMEAWCVDWSEPVKKPTLSPSHSPSPSPKPSPSRVVKITVIEYEK